MFKAGILPTAAALTALVVGANSAPAVAQSRVSVTPTIGMYNPIGQLRADSTVELLQLMTLMVGTRVTVSLGQGFSIEGSAGWTPAPSWVAQSDWQQTVDLDGKVAIASLRGRYQFNTRSDASDGVLSVISGLGVVHRYGQAWDGVTGTTDGAVVVGGSWFFGSGSQRANTNRKWSLSSRLTYGVEVECFVSRTSFTDLGQRTGARLHADLVTSLGFGLSL